MRDSPGSVVTLLCSGIQLYSAERRIVDCILKDVKWASVVTSAQLAHASQSSEATVTRLCHKLGFENYRKFQLALARDVMEQQEVEVLHSSSPDPLRQTLQSVQSNRQEEIRATIQALNLRQLRKAMSVLRSAEIIEIEATDNSLPVAMDASLKLGGLGKRCMTSGGGANPKPFPRHPHRAGCAAAHLLRQPQRATAGNGPHRPRARGCDPAHHLRPPLPAGRTGRLPAAGLQPRPAHRGYRSGPLTPLVGPAGRSSVLPAPDRGRPFLTAKTARPPSETSCFLCDQALKTYRSIRRNASSMRERGDARFIRRWQGPWNILPS